MVIEISKYMLIRSDIAELVTYRFYIEVLYFTCYKTKPRTFITILRQGSNHISQEVNIKFLSI